MDLCITQKTGHRAISTIQPQRHEFVMNANEADYFLNQCGDLITLLLASNLQFAPICGFKFVG